MQLDKWTENIDPNTWDKYIANHNGHPLQSALWGEARKTIDGIESQYICHFSNNIPDFMARVETRSIKGMGNIAWIPKGPVWDTHNPSILTEFCDNLRRNKYNLLVTDEYSTSNNTSQQAVQTIYINLEQDIDTLFSNLDKQWRYGVRRAKKEGVEILSEQSETKIAEFFNLCQKISESKSFELPGSLPLVNFLLTHSFNENVKFELITSNFEDQVISGAIIAKSGQNIHYFWGASDRNFPKLRGGEAVQWEVIESGSKQGFQRYDLEGIDPINNPGVFAFKKKMGGEIVNLTGKQYLSLDGIGKVLKLAGKLLNRI